MIMVVNRKKHSYKAENRKKYQWTSKHDSHEHAIRIEVVDSVQTRKQSARQFDVLWFVSVRTSQCRTSKTKPNSGSGVY